MIKVIFAPMDRASLAETYRTGGLRAVRSAFADITTESAQASVEADAKAIREIITTQLRNGFATLDQILREKLSALVIETLADGEATTDGTDAPTHKNLVKSLHHAISAGQLEVVRFVAKQGGSVVLGAKNQVSMLQ